jgi:ATP-dependent Clp protease, protease subunit
MNKRFWVWDKLEENTLHLNGVIAEQSWLGDEITPGQFKQDLIQHAGDITVWLNSPGGDVFAAVQIYNMLKEHDGKVTVKIDSLAASAASVIAMAGDEVLISPSGLFMLHDPMSIAFGNESDLTACIEMLREVKEAIINAYELKTGAQRAKLSQFMSNETWLNARKAVEWGFADSILFSKKQQSEPGPAEDAGFLFNTRGMAFQVINKLKGLAPEPKGTPVDQLHKRLNLIKH